MKTYKKGQTINTLVKLTANHRGGRFEFKLCNLDANGNKESEACFNQYGIITTYKLTSIISQDFNVQVKLPNITCKRCVLQWTYIVGKLFFIIFNIILIIFVSDNNNHN